MEVLVKILLIFATVMLDLMEGMFEFAGFKWIELGFGFADNMLDGGVHVESPSGVMDVPRKKTVTFAMTDAADSSQPQIDKGLDPVLQRTGRDLRQFHPDDLFIGAPHQLVVGRQAAEEMIEMGVGKSQAASVIEHGDGHAQGMEPVQQLGGIGRNAHILCLSALQSIRPV